PGPEGVLDRIPCRTHGSVGRAGQPLRNRQQVRDIDDPVGQVPDVVPRGLRAVDLVQVELVTTLEASSDTLEPTDEKLGYPEGHFGLQRGGGKLVGGERGEALQRADRGIELAGEDLVHADQSKAAN